MSDKVLVQVSGNGDRFNYIVELRLVPCISVWDDVMCSI